MFDQLNIIYWTYSAIIITIYHGIHWILELFDKYQVLGGATNDFTESSINKNSVSGHNVRHEVDQARSNRDKLINNIYASKLLIYPQRSWSSSLGAGQRYAMNDQRKEFIVA